MSLLEDVGSGSKGASTGLDAQGCESSCDPGERTLIVGAGLTGLVAAIELARRGFTPRIVDRDAGPADESRALGINARSLSILEPAGITRLLLEQGRRLREIVLRSEDDVMVRLRLSDIGGRHPFIVVMPQGDFEALLVEVLAGLGIEVEWRTELTALAQGEDGVRVRLRWDGRERDVHADRVVGADGAHSFVRGAIGQSFEGSAYPTEWGLADLEVRTALPLDAVHAFDRAGPLVAVIPIRESLVRVVCSVPEVLDHVPPDFVVERVIWQSRFRIAHRQVTWWEASGDWTGTVTLPGESAIQRTSGLADPVPGQTERRIRLCELSTLVLGMTFVPIERDRPAAIEVRTARPLCNEGSTEITGGAVLIWTNPGSDENVLGAARSDAWAVTGEIEVTSYESHPLPDLDAGDTAETEHIEGTLSLTATDDAGAVIRIENATFHITVEANRVRMTIS